MKEVFKRFSLMDVLGYLFPGLSGLSGCLVGVELTRWGDALTWSDAGVLGGISLLILSYVFGVVQSGFSWPILKVADRLFLQRKKPRDPRDEIYPPEGFATRVERVFSHVFGEKIGEKGWSENHFYLVRSLVEQCLPRQASLAARQNALRVLRQYMLPPLVIWTSVGVMWGVSLFSNESTPAAGTFIIFASLGVGITAVRLVVERMWKNRRREVREICLALIVGDALAAFSHDRPEGESV